jgi:hypothetical protein
LDSSEYTASTGTSIVFNTNCVVGDKVEVVAYTYNATGFTGVGGSGTTNTIAKWTASGTLNNSQIFDNGTNVGIGTTTLGGRLDVRAGGTSAFTYYFRNAAGNYGGGIYNTGGNNTQLYLATSAGTENVVLSASGASYLLGGSLAVGTSNPTGRLMLYSTGNVFQNIVSPSGGSTQVGINLSPSMSDGELASNPAQASIYATDSNYSANIIFATKSPGAIGNSITERLRIQAGGTLLIGGASPSGAYDCSLGNATTNTYYQVRSTNCNSLYGADTRGTWMGNLSSREVYVNTPSFVPGGDNSTTCGSSSYRWSAVYAVNGSIQTSDERQKTDIANSDLGLDFIEALNPVSYKWKIGGNDVEYSSVEDENGNLTPTSTSTPRKGVRTHYGLIAQQVKEVLGDKDFGGFVHDKETDAMSLRYDQFIAPLVKAIQEQQAQISAQSIEIENLKKLIN